VVLLLHARREEEDSETRRPAGPPFLDGQGQGTRGSGSIPYVGDEVVEDGERGALAEVDLVGDAGLLDAGQAELVVLAVDVHGQDLRTEPLSVGCCCCSGTGKADLGGREGMS